MNNEGAKGRRRGRGTGSRSGLEPFVCVGIRFADEPDLGLGWRVGWVAGDGIGAGAVVV